MTVNEIVARDDAGTRAMTPWLPSGPATPMEMIANAVTNGAGLDVIEKLMALQERWEANQGRKAFDHAIALAKAEIPPIIKNRTVDFTSAKGRTHYQHEDMAGIARVVDPILGKHGLSYRYRTAQDGQTLTVTCILSHRDGYSEETTLSSASDQSGNKNHIQAVGSAATYLQRYTLKMALGLAAAADDDGKAAEGPERINAEEAADLRERLTGLSETDFCRFMGIGSVEELPAKRWGDALSAIEKARAARARAAEKGKADA